MQPFLFSIHLGSLSFAIKAYPFFLFLAGTVAFIASCFVLKRSGLSRTRSVFSTILLLASAFVGARILHGFLNLGFYRQHPERWWAFDTQGFAVLGGILSAGVIFFALSKFFQLDPWKLSDRMVPFLGVSIALARVGCFLNGCCFGRETDLPWGVIFPSWSPAHKYQLSGGSPDLFSVHPVHPTELYELLAALIGSFLALYCLKRKLPAGVATLTFGTWYVAFRLLDDFLRIPSGTFDAPTSFYPIFYSSLVLVGAFLLIKKLRNWLRNPV